MSRSYAEGTSVSVEASRLEIERVLARYKADAFAYVTEGRHARIMFRIASRYVRFELTLPDPQDDAFWLYTRGAATYRRVDADGQARWEQACRQKWRALNLVVKAKLEAVAAGITTIEDEFLAHTVLADGKTVGETIRPQLEEHLRLGGPPVLRLGAPQ